MIREIATISIDPAQAEAFEAAVAAAAPLFQRSSGCRSMALERVIEDPAKYRLVVGWDSVDHHMVTFRGSEEFKQWRERAGPFFKAVAVEHVREIGVYF